MDNSPEQEHRARGADFIIFKLASQLLSDVWRFKYKEFWHVVCGRTEAEVSTPMSVYEAAVRFTISIGRESRAGEPRVVTW